MASTLNDSLQVVLPHLSHHLAGLAEKRLLVALASHLPPIDRAGFECRLANSDSRVDIAQSIMARGGERKILADFLEDSCRSRGELCQLRPFVAAWNDPDSLFFNSVSNIWLEFDLQRQSNTNKLSVPAVFITPQKELEKKQLLEVVSTAYAILLPHADRSRCISHLQKYSEIFWPQGRIKYVGFMLSRKSSVTRVLITGSEMGAAVQFIRKVYAHPLAASVRHILDTVGELCSDVMLSVDIDEAISKRIGVELFFDQDGKGYRELAKILDFLVQQELCTENKREHLLKWPGQSDPGNCEGVWPGHLIIQSLVRPVDEFSIIERRINHVKLVVDHGRIQAKAYFGFEHRFMKF